MQLFLRTPTATKAISVENNMNTLELQEMIREVSLIRTFTFPFSIQKNVSDVFSDMQTICVAGPVCGGGNNMSDADQSIAIANMTCKICRKCYARNAIKAKTCRKKMCGHSSQLRLKKTISGKKK